MALAAGHWSVARRESSGGLEATLEARLAAVARRHAALVASASSAAERVAHWPESQAALQGDSAALGRLFDRLERDRGDRESAPALAVHRPQGGTLAWSGRIEDRRQAEAGLLLDRPGLRILGNGVSTTLLATAPIRSAAGAVLGLASAEIPMAERRNIQSGSLSDFDRLADVAPGLAVRYVDPLDGLRQKPAARDAPGSRELSLRGPDGRLLAVVRATNRGAAQAVTAALALHRRILSALTLLALLQWTLRPRASAVRLAIGVTALRASLLLLGPPLPSPHSPLLSPAAYASAALGPLLRSPLDLLFSGLWAFCLALLLLRRALRMRSAGSRLTALAADILSATALLGSFALLADACANSALALEAFSPAPGSLLLIVAQSGLLLGFSAGATLVASLLVLTTRDASALSLVWRVARIALIAAAGCLLLSSPGVVIPVLPAVLWLLLAALLARESRNQSVSTASLSSLAALLLGATAGLSALLGASLAHFTYRSAAREIESSQAPLLLGQPEWRRYVLGAARHRVDQLSLLEESTAHPHPPLLEELAFSVWSETELTRSGLPSAIELQDASGNVVSRFAIGMPAPPTATLLPPLDDWEVTRERLPLASAERFALHARRRLSYHGEVHGAVHLYVADDLLALPPAASRDPYSILLRTTPAPAHERPVELIAWSRERALLFSSADRPPALDPALAARVLERPAGVWTRLPVGGTPRAAFLFSDGATIFALCQETRGAALLVADLLEAVSAGLLLVLSVAGVVLLTRSLLRCPSFSLSELLRSVRSRFTLRLFVAFSAAAFLPVIVLNTVVRGFVAERLKREAEDQALDLAAVAKKAVEDFAFFQRGESPGHEPVTDAALVWVSSLIRNDLDVFEGGRLTASSKRELYASGLLPDRVSGTVFRELVLEGAPSALRTERIGGLSYRVVSVPVSLSGDRPAILSIPLALREREVQAVLDDLDRSIRLASMLFLSAAALLALGVARRISEPLHDLTEATRRVASGDLRARVTTSNRDEFLTLVDSFNQMAGDLERQRRDLERVSRVAAWAEMARQVAHEVKNPLTPIQLATEHLRRVYADRRSDLDQVFEACTETILKQVRSLREIVTEFSSFARPATPEAAPLDLASLVRSAVGPYHGVLPPQVSLRLDLRVVPGVVGDRRLLERAVVNLIENALQAVGERGAIEVRVAAEPGRAFVEVVDSGPGPDPEVRARAFEPFFSTKTGGSGLGLALVRKIAQDHGGGASLEGEPGRTRARLWLPEGPVRPS